MSSETPFLCFAFCKRIFISDLSGKFRRMPFGSVASLGARATKCVSTKEIWKLSLLNIKLRKNVNTIHLLTPDMYPRLILITPSCPYELPLRVPRLLFHLDKKTIIDLWVFNTTSKFFGCLGTHTWMQKQIKAKTSCFDWVKACMNILVYDSNWQKRICTNISKICFNPWFSNLTFVIATFSVGY